MWLTQPPGGARETLSRWFHVKVENRRRKFVTATEVRLWMIELKIPNAAGAWTTDWIGELPFVWKDQIVKLPTLSMGQPDKADLCCVIKDYQDTGQHILRLTPVLQKSPPQTEWAGACQGRSVLRSVTGDLGFPRAEMSESIRDNPNRRLSHAGVAIGDFALDP